MKQFISQSRPTVSLAIVLLSTLAWANDRAEPTNGERGVVVAVKDIDSIQVARKPATDSVQVALTEVFSVDEFATEYAGIKKSLVDDLRRNAVAFLGNKPVMFSRVDVRGSDRPLIDLHVMMFELNQQWSGKRPSEQVAIGYRSLTLALIEEGISLPKWREDVALPIYWVIQIESAAAFAKKGGAGIWGRDDAKSVIRQFESETNAATQSVVLDSDPQLVGRRLKLWLSTTPPVRRGILKAARSLETVDASAYDRDGVLRTLRSRIRVEPINDIAIAILDLAILLDPSSPTVRLTLEETIESHRSEVVQVHAHKLLTALKAP